MNNKTNALLGSQLTEFFSDPDVTQAMEWVRDRNVFDVLMPDERRMSNVIAWLLDPNQGHGMGDFFLKELLKAASLQTGEKFPKDWSSYDIALTSFYSAIVVTEYQVGEGRLDILVYDYDNDLVVAIENKFGAREGDGQTAGYGRVIDERFGDLHKVFVYLDYYGNGKEKEQWINLDYEWLQTALERTVNRDILPARANWLLSDLRNFLAEDFEPDPCYRGLPRLLAGIAHRHQVLLKKLDVKKDEIEGEAAKPLHKLSDFKYLDDPDNGVHFILHKHRAFLDALADYQCLEHLGESVKESFSEIPVEYEVGQRYVRIHQERWRLFYCPDFQHWAIYIELTEPSTEGDEGFQVAVRMDTDNLLEKSWDRIEEFAEKVGGRVSRRGRHIRLVITREPDEATALGATKRTMVAIDQHISLLAHANR